MMLSADPELQETAITKAVLLQWKATRLKSQSELHKLSSFSHEDSILEVGDTGVERMENDL